MQHFHLQQHPTYAYQSSRFAQTGPDRDAAISMKRSSHTSAIGGVVWCGVVRGQVAVEGILDEEVQVYAVELLSKRPAQIEQFCREVQQAQNATADATAGATIPAGSAAANDSESFEHRCLRAKEHNCGICQDNFAIDGKVADSPARINASLAGGTSMCEHEYCTSCWDTLAARAVPSATGPRGKRPLFPFQIQFPDACPEPVWATRRVFIGYENSKRNVVVVFCPQRSLALRAAGT
jgi:hypothetical protein